MSTFLPLIPEILLSLEKNKSSRKKQMMVVVMRGGNYSSKTSSSSRYITIGRDSMTIFSFC
jgi:hypothetical protein